MSEIQTFRDIATFPHCYIANFPHYYEYISLNLAQDTATQAVLTTMIAPRDDINAALKCVANTTKNLISLLYDDEDDHLLLSEQSLSHRVPRPVPIGKVTTNTTRSPPICNKRTASTPSKRTARKRKLVLHKSYAVISVLTRGNDGDACRNSWHRKEIKIVGVYTSKQAAESAKSGVMDLYKRGHGEILAGGCLDDELDMFIREDTRCMIGPRST
jgi:hypothetical protein